MDLLPILKEREIKWTKILAECAEHFTAQGARSGSGFQLALVDHLVEELEARCLLYLEHPLDQVDFDAFFKTQKMNLCSEIKSRFNVSISGEEKCNCLEEKYKATMLSNRPPVPKSPIGFNAK